MLEASAYGAYWDPIAKTNINPKTDLFEKEIEDYGTFKKAMDVLKEQVFGAQMQRGSQKTGASDRRSSIETCIISWINA